MQVLFPFYVLLSIIILILAGNNYLKDKKINYIITFSLFSLYISFLSSRSFEHPGDTGTYLYIFNYIKDNPDFWNFRLEKGFLILVKSISLLTLDDRLFLFFVAFVNSIIWLFCFKIWFNVNKLALVSLTFISLFFSYNLGGNVLRQGIAIPLILISVKLWENKKFLISFVFIFLALTFHNSVIIVIVAYIISRFNVDIKKYFIVFVVVTLLSYFGAFKNIVPFLQGDVDSYKHILSENSFSNYKVGFRFDFWLYSSFVLILYFLLTDEYKFIYLNLMKMYIVILCFFIIMFDIPYSDRVGIYCWSLYPFILVGFIGGYKLKFINNEIIYIICITIIGVLSFIYYPVMNLGWFMNDII